MDLLAILKNVSVENTVILTQASCGYLDFAENWILHAIASGVKNWLTIAEDASALSYLEHKYSGHIVPASIFSSSAELRKPTALSNAGSSDFEDMMCARLAYQRAILALGFSMMWSDIDTAWFQDPMKLFPKGYDYVGVDDQWPYETDEHDSPYLCGCMSLWAPTPQTFVAYDKWQEACHSGAGDDQIAWAATFKGELREKLRYYIMPRQLYPNGKFIDGISLNISADHKFPTSIMPAWIHANWRRGSSSKHEFFIGNNAWKVDPTLRYPDCASTRES